MTTQDTRFVQTIYSGEPAEKLAVARSLLAQLRGRLAAWPLLAPELEQLRRDSEALDAHMRAMDLGPLCSQCAARPSGGCCSAFMAGNTDAIQMLLNLLLGVAVAQQPESGENCCFLGPRGCLFLVKPIFCLNYNCTHILDSAGPESLSILYQRAAAVLSQQTRIETLLLEKLRRWDKQGESL